IAAPHHEALLGPYDLRADREPLSKKTLCNRRSVQCAVPDIGDIARKERPRRSPVRLVVVKDLACSFRAIDARPVTPGRFVRTAVWRIGANQGRNLASGGARPPRRVCTATAADPV